MVDKITLGNIASFQNDSTAIAQYNANNALITTAFDNTLFRDVTSPNQMLSPLDMNSNQIINLPNPATTTSPLRLQDLNSFIGGGTITNIPAGGTTGQALIKVNSSNYNVTWGTVASVGNTQTWSALQSFQPNTLGVLGTSTGVTTLASANTTASNFTITFPAATDLVITQAAAQTLTSKSVNSLTWLGASSGAISVNPQAAAGTYNFNLPITSGTANQFLVSGGGGSTAMAWIANPLPVVSGGSGTTTATGTSGSIVLSNSPTLVTPTLGAAIATSLNFSPSTGGIIGTVTNDNTNAGNVGEYVSSLIVAGSAVSLSNSITANITSISLTAGDWEVTFEGYFAPAATTSITQLLGSISTTSATLNQTPGNFGQYQVPAQVPGTSANVCIQCSNRYSLSTTTTLFAVAFAAFTVSTMTVFGGLRARRIR